jgi:pantothenate kinase
MPTATFEDLTRRLAQPASTDRRIVAVVGAPGSGKSTLAERLAAALPGAAVLPMDGYHYDDGLLRARGMLARKGAPDTFDVSGFGHMLQRLRRNEEDEIAVPVFDRDLEISRAGARMIGREVKMLIVEGNYLLLATPPWSHLHALYDVTVALDVPEAELRRRLVARWRGYGYAEDQITAKVEGNDLPNGRFVRESSKPADFILSD